jgi:hypothetical protein
MGLESRGVLFEDLGCDSGECFNPLSPFSYRSQDLQLSFRLYLVSFPQGEFLVCKKVRVPSRLKAE